MNLICHLSKNPFLFDLTFHLLTVKLKILNINSGWKLTAEAVK